MPTYESLQAIGGEFYLEKRHLGHAVRWRGELGGHPLEWEIHYVSRIYSPRGDSAESCRHWCAERGIPLND